MGLANVPEGLDWNLFLGVALGLLGYYGASILDFIGLQYISAALERLILFTYPTITVLIGVLAAYQRDYFSDAETNCAEAGSIAALNAALDHDDDIAAFEAVRPSWKPVTIPS